MPLLKIENKIVLEKTYIYISKVSCNFLYSNINYVPQKQFARGCLNIAFRNMALVGSDL